MATWFAQNSSVNIDSVNQWNSAANGSGSWLTWASLDAADILVANGKTAIAINVSFTCATITNAATGGTAGGGFTLNASVTVTANVITGHSVSCVTVAGGAGIDSYVIGNITATSSAAGITHTGVGSLTVTGNVSSSSADVSSSAQQHGVYSTGSGTVTIVGNCTSLAVTNNNNHGVSKTSGVLNITGSCVGGNNTTGSGYGAFFSTSASGAVVGSATGGAGSATCSGVHISSTGSVSITGTLTASSQSQALSCATASTIIHSGNAVAASNGIPAVRIQNGALLISPSVEMIHTYRVNNSGSAGVARSLYTGGTNLGQPVVANVRSGTAFGASSEYTGTLAVPSPTLVAIGVSTDNTVGSYAPTGGLDAAGVRTAIGLATANLDTQLSGIQSDTNDIQTRLPAALESGRIAAVLDSATATQIDNIEATLTTLGSESTTVERSVSDTNAITFSWPVSGATITGTASLNNGAYGAVAGAIAFLRTETGRHYYTLAYNAADRPSAEGQVRYKFVDGTHTGYVVLRTVNLVTVAQVNAQVLDVLSVDTFGELSSPPAATSSLKDKLVWLFMWARNKATATSSQRKLFADDTTTVVSTETITDDGTTFTKGEAS